jgi:hypothetical protein
MDVLVAGGTGFIGRPVCRVLVDRGHRVTAASRSPDGVSLPDGVVRARADVTDADLRDLVAGHDAVINLVALPSHVQPDASRDILTRRERRGFLQGKARYARRFRNCTPRGSSVGVPDSPPGVPWWCHSHSHPVASHRPPVSKAGSLPTGRGDRRCWPPR